MMTPNPRADEVTLRANEVTMRTPSRSSSDGDMRKGAIEDGLPCARSNSPGLDDEGLPNDEIAIAEDAIGAREDGSQG